MIQDTMELDDDDIDDTDVDKLILGMEDEAKNKKIRDMERLDEEEEPVWLAFINRILIALEKITVSCALKNLPFHFQVIWFNEFMKYGSILWRTYLS